MNLITYTGADEVLISTEAHEPELLFEYFEQGGRNLDEYDREVYNGVVEVSTCVRTNGDKEVS